MTEAATSAVLPERYRLSGRRQMSRSCISSICLSMISTDFYPTMLEMAGLVRQPEQHMDGVSMVSLLKQTGSTAERALYWHYPHYGDQGGSPGSAIRVGDWKLIEFFEDRRLELYNLRNDLGEQHNLAGTESKKAAELYERLKTWRAAVGARVPSPNPNRKVGDQGRTDIPSYIADD